MRESITDTRRQRRHSWNGDTCFLARFLRASSSEFPSSELSIVDLESSIESFGKFSRRTNFLLERRAAFPPALLPPSLLFSSFLPLLLPFPRFVESSTRVNRVFCSVFDGGRLVARNRGERYKFGVNFVPGIIYQSIAAYIRPHRRESKRADAAPRFAINWPYLFIPWIFIGTGERRAVNRR